MAAQEFSSPGEHMASQSLSSSGVSVAYRDPNNPSGRSNVIYAGPINNAYANYQQERNTFNSARDYSDYVRDFNKSYMTYNENLFNSARDYDMYMSNTAIQRQVADLKKAGLNPILGAYLGGAQYKGVSVPYVSVNPASALQAYTAYDASIYGSDTSYRSSIDSIKLKTSSDQLISQYQKTMDRIINGDKIDAEKALVELKRDADKYLDDCHMLNEKELQSIGFKNEKDLALFRSAIDRDFYNWKNGWSSGPDVITNFANKITRLIPGARGIFVD